MEATTDVWRVTDDREEDLAVKVFRANYGDDHKIKVNTSLVKYNYATQFHRGSTKSSRFGSG